MARASKGARWERLFATQLSLWWTEEERDDAFWRVLGSGGRATNRGKRGKQTSGGYGDICATDAAGQPLLDLFVWELKCGYKDCSIQDILDKPSKTGHIFDFISQAKSAASLAGTKYWALVYKKDRREPLLMTNHCLEWMAAPVINICVYDEPQEFNVVPVKNFLTSAAKVFLEKEIENARKS